MATCGCRICWEMCFQTEQLISSTAVDKEEEDFDGQLLLSSYKLRERKWIITEDLS